MSSSLLLKRTCVCEFHAAKDLSVHSVVNVGIMFVTYSVVEQVEKDQLVVLFSESPCSDAKLLEVMSSCKAFGRVTCE